MVGEINPLYFFPSTISVWHKTKFRKWGKYCCRRWKLWNCNVCYIIKYEQLVLVWLFIWCATWIHWKSMLLVSIWCSLSVIALMEQTGLAFSTSALDAVSRNVDLVSVPVVEDICKEFDVISTAQWISSHDFKRVCFHLFLYSYWTCARIWFSKFLFPLFRFYWKETVFWLMIFQQSIIEERQILLDNFSPLASCEYYVFQVKLDWVIGSRNENNQSIMLLNTDMQIAIIRTWI